MPKRIIDSDVIYKGVIYAAERDNNGKSVETEIEVPDGFPQGIGREPETSAQRQRAPLQTFGATGASAGADTGASAGASAGSAPNAGQSGGQASEPVDYESMGKDELQALAEQRGVAEQITGSGANGRVLKSDLVAKLQEGDSAGAAGDQAGDQRLA